MKVFIGTIQEKTMASTTLKVLCEAMGVSYRGALKWLDAVTTDSGKQLCRECGGYSTETGAWRIVEVELLKVKGRGKGGF